MSESLTLALSLRAALLPLRTPCDFLFKAGHDISMGDGNCREQAFRDVQVGCVCGGQVSVSGRGDLFSGLGSSSPLAGSGVLAGWSWGLLSPRGTSSDETPAGWVW